MKFPLRPATDIKEYHAFFALVPHRCEHCDMAFWLERGYQKFRFSQAALDVYWVDYICSECFHGRGLYERG